MTWVCHYKWGIDTTNLRGYSASKHQGFSQQEFYLPSIMRIFTKHFFWRANTHTHTQKNWGQQGGSGNWFRGRFEGKKHDVMTNILWELHSIHWFTSKTGFLEDFDSENQRILTRLRISNRIGFDMIWPKHQKLSHKCGTKKPRSTKISSVAVEVGKPLRAHQHASCLHWWS